jgi:hypothetical protein
MVVVSGQEMPANVEALKRCVEARQPQHPA